MVGSKVLLSILQEATSGFIMLETLEYHLSITILCFSQDNMYLGDEDEDDEKVRPCAGCVFLQFFVESVSLYAGEYVMLIYDFMWLSTSLSTRPCRCILIPANH